MRKEIKWEKFAKKIIEVTEGRLNQNPQYFLFHIEQTVEFNCSSVFYPPHQRQTSEVNVGRRQHVSLNSILL